MLVTTPRSSELGAAGGNDLRRTERPGRMEVATDGGSLCAKFATEHLTVAAARIESHLVGTGGNDGGNVVQFPTFSLRSARKKKRPPSLEAA